jgi:hypothetical protein
MYSFLCLYSFPPKHSPVTPGLPFFFFFFNRNQYRNHTFYIHSLLRFHTRESIFGCRLFPMFERLANERNETDWFFFFRFENEHTGRKAEVGHCPNNYGRPRLLAYIECVPRRPNSPNKVPGTFHCNKKKFFLCFLDRRKQPRPRPMLSNRKVMSPVDTAYGALSKGGGRYEVHPRTPTGHRKRLTWPAQSFPHMQADPPCDSRTSWHPPDG